MKLSTRIERRYVAIWHVNVEGVPRPDVATYMEAVKESMSNGLGDPFDELAATLEAPVCGYWIPQRGGHTRLELQEFKFEVAEEDYDEEI